MSDIETTVIGGIIVWRHKKQVTLDVPDGKSITTMIMLSIATFSTSSPYLNKLLDQDGRHFEIPYGSNSSYVFNCGFSFKLNGVVYNVALNDDYAYINAIGDLGISIAYSDFTEDISHILHQLIRLPLMRGPVAHDGDLALTVVSNIKHTEGEQDYITSVAINMKLNSHHPLNHYGGIRVLLLRKCSINDARYTDATMRILRNFTMRDNRIFYCSDTGDELCEIKSKEDAICEIRQRLLLLFNGVKAMRSHAQH